MCFMGERSILYVRASSYHQNCLRSTCPETCVNAAWYMCSTVISKRDVHAMKSNRDYRIHALML
jgi:hypothetical protein